MSKMRIPRFTDEQFQAYERAQNSVDRAQTRYYYKKNRPHITGRSCS